MKRKFIFLMAMLCLVCGRVGAEEATINLTASSDNTGSTVSWSDGHATFTLTGGNLTWDNTNECYTLDANTTYTLTWAANNGYTFNKVTGVVVNQQSYRTRTNYTHGITITPEGGSSVEYKNHSAFGNAEIGSQLNLQSGSKVTLTTGVDKDGLIWTCYFTYRLKYINITYDYTPNKYTIAFDANGGSGSTASVPAVYDVNATLTQNGFIKDGYTFAGWNTNADGTGTSYNDGATVKNLSSTAGATVTLYAQWSPCTYIAQDVKAYTCVDGEYKYIARGGEWNTQAIPESSPNNALSVDVLKVGDYIRIQCRDTKQFVYDAGDYKVFTDNVATASTAYNFVPTVTSDGGYKLTLPNDANYSLGIDGERLYLVSTASAPTWYFGKTNASLVISSAVKYGTFVAPFDVTLPSGVKAYTVSGSGTNEDGKDCINISEMTLTNNVLPANTPIITNSSTNVEEEFSGYPTGSQNANGGKLTGSYEADVKVPAGSYVLQKNNGVFGFYKVAENSTVKLKKNRAYLTIETLVKANFAISITEETAISEVNTIDVSVSSIYSVSGVKGSAMQKGLNIVKCSDGSVKKVLVK